MVNMKSKRDELLEWLKSNLNKPMSVKQISEESGISYPTVLKWIQVLSSERKISMIDLKNVKLVTAVKI